MPFRSNFILPYRLSILHISSIKRSTSSIFIHFSIKIKNQTVSPRAASDSRCCYQHIKAVLNNKFILDYLICLWFYLHIHKSSISVRSFEFECLFNCFPVLFFCAIFSSSSLPEHQNELYDRNLKSECTWDLLAWLPLKAFIQHRHSFHLNQNDAITNVTQPICPLSICK